MTDVQANNNVMSVPEQPQTMSDSECGDTDNMTMSTSPYQKYLQVPKIQELMDDGTGSPYTSEEEVLDHDDDAHNEATGEKDDENWVPPEDELVQKIIKQVEFYFSDANIVKDAFLLKHVRRNKEGYVSLKLITSFKKMKSLTKDWKAVKYSLEKSDKLVTNQEGTKVKRVHALPEYDETTPSRSIVAVNLPMQEPTIEAIADKFSSCGEIVLVRILRPGKPLPQDVKRHQTQHPELGSTVCAVVEFEKSESARKAIENLNDKTDWRNGMHVATLSKITPKKKTKDKKEQRGEKQNGEKPERNSLSPPGNQNTDGCDDSENEEKGKRRRKKKNSRVEELVKRGDTSGFSSSSDVEASSPSPNRKGLKTTPNNKQLSPNVVGQNHLSPNSPKSSPHSSPRSSPRARRKGNSAFLSPKASPKASPELSRKKTDYSSDGSGSSSPWVQRRRMLAAQEQATDGSPRSSPLLSRRMVDPSNPNNKPCLAGMDGVIRQPRGPDGTKGFTMGRGKPIVVS